MAKLVNGDLTKGRIYEDLLMLDVTHSFYSLMFIGKYVNAFVTDSHSDSLYMYANGKKMPFSSHLCK